MTVSYNCLSRCNINLSAALASKSIKVMTKIFATRCVKIKKLLKVMAKRILIRFNSTVNTKRCAITHYLYHAACDMRTVIRVGDIELMHLN